MTGQSIIISFFAGALGLFLTITAASATQHATSGPKVGGMMGAGMMPDGLMMPSMDPARGRKLFASKGCVVCHSVNGIGGKDASPLDASSMAQAMNPFEFAAKMWRGAEAMIILQQETLGEQIDLSGEDLANIIAFSHHPEEQRKFTESDIPARIRELIEHVHEEGDAHGAKDD